MSPAGGGIKGGGWGMSFIICMASSPRHFTWLKRPPPKGDSLVPRCSSKIELEFFFNLFAKKARKKTARKLHPGLLKNFQGFSQSRFCYFLKIFLPIRWIIHFQRDTTFESRSFQVFKYLSQR